MDDKRQSGSRYALHTTRVPRARSVHLATADPEGSADDAAEWAAIELGEPIAKWVRGGSVESGAGRSRYRYRCAPA